MLLCVPVWAVLDCSLHAHFYLICFCIDSTGLNKYYSYVNI